MLKPIDARLIVKKAKREEQTASGIVLPDTVSDQNQTAQGEVVAVEIHDYITNNYNHDKIYGIWRGATFNFNIPSMG